MGFFFFFFGVAEMSLKNNGCHIMENEVDIYM